MYVWQDAAQTDTCQEDIIALDYHFVVHLINIGN